ncbi:hypothetical protein PHYSODRAFT_321099 [Phytophthora sojae]|uniref:Uncharacterized protein n=1 Tax=Phytophthora sojae (strain P6497) TaxID=1094619 RepID=G4YEJ2_PHYSP|nr:hypothetical protein PHYSODRAFT_321099 [Phytophthora sojae]EGZ27269.1 hypothetical protein PHYSODRAFT_321099 [Phytophthora sojae]|eukprot:XP_009514544.1 hypothetical protein PHYSODRAFT_321099 [Phytophthora sojae]
MQTHSSLVLSSPDCSPWPNALLVHCWASSTDTGAHPSALLLQDANTRNVRVLGETHRKLQQRHSLRALQWPMPLSVTAMAIFMITTATWAPPATSPMPVALAATSTSELTNSRLCNR